MGEMGQPLEADFFFIFSEPQTRSFGGKGSSLGNFYFRNRGMHVLDDPPVVICMFFLGVHQGTGLGFPLVCLMIHFEVAFWSFLGVVLLFK